MVELNESDLMVTEMIMGVGIEFENFTNWLSWGGGGMAIE